MNGPISRLTPWLRVCFDCGFTETKTEPVTYWPEHNVDYCYRCSTRRLADGELQRIEERPRDAKPTVEVKWGDVTPVDAPDELDEWPRILGW